MTSNIRSNGVVDSLTATVELVDGLGNDRVVIMAATQRRSTINLASPTFDGVAPSQVISEFSGGAYAVYTYKWNDADLPATAGTYTGTITGAVTNCSVMLVSMSGGAQTAATTLTNAATTTSMTNAVSSSGTDLSLIFAIQNNAAAVWTHGSGQTPILDTGNGNATSGSRVHGGSYEQGESSLSITSTLNETAVWQALSVPATGGGGGTVIEDAGGTVDVDLGDLSVTVSGSGTITPALTVSGSGDYSADIAVTANGSGTITPPGGIGGSGSFSASIGVSASGSGSVTDGSVVPHTVTITSTNVLRREQNHFVLPISIRDISGGNYSPVTAHWRLDDPDTDINLSPDQSITPQADINLLVPASVLDMNDEAQLTERRILTFTTNRGLPTETNTQYSFPLENLEFV